MLCKNPGFISSAAHGDCVFHNIRTSEGTFLNLNLVQIKYGRKLDSSDLHLTPKEDVPQSDYLPQIIV